MLQSTSASTAKRAAMVVVDGVIKACNIAEAPDDPAGDDHPEVCDESRDVISITSLREAETRLMNGTHTRGGPMLLPRSYSRLQVSCIEAMIPIFKKVAA